MKLKDQQIMHLTFKSPLKNTQFDPPICLVPSIESSVKKSSRSTHLTERSSSRNKVMIPNSQKLANFFTSTRPYSSQKSFSVTSTNHIARKQREEKKPKLQFLKDTLNRDYFDQNTQRDIIKRIDVKGNQANNFGFKAQKKGPREIVNLCSYKSQTLIRSQTPRIAFPKIKHPSSKLPHQFFNPVQKANKGRHKDKKYRVEAHAQNYSKHLNERRNELEYTFGLNY